VTSKLRAWPFAMAAVGLAVAFVLIYWFFVRTYSGQIVDARAFNGALGQHGRLARLIGASLSFVPYVGIGGGVLITLLIGAVTRRPRQMVVALAVGALACVLAELGKYVFLSRPETGATDAFNNSFPSGHTTVAASAAFSVFLAATPRWRPLAAVLGGLFASFTGVLLLTAQWHRPSDIVAGYVLVAACGCLGGMVLALWHVPASTRPTWSLRVLWWIAGLAGFLSLAAFVVILATRFDHGQFVGVAYAGGICAIVAVGLGLTAAGNRFFRAVS
jgi:membrane-associated phospholipid phosphatase